MMPLSDEWIEKKQIKGNETTPFFHFESGPGH